MKVGDRAPNSDPNQRLCSLIQTNLHEIKATPLHFIISPLSLPQEAATARIIIILQDLDIIYGPVGHYANESVYNRFS